MKDFPIPVVSASIGPSSQPDDEMLEYLPMPQGMETFRAPVLPEAHEFRRMRTGAPSAARSARAT